MISAILFDLDDTLLENDINRFLPSYLQSLGKFIAPRLDPSRLTDALMAGTQAMLRNDDPEITLQQAFDAIFFPMVGLNRASLGPEFDRFYQEGYPLLKGLELAEIDELMASFRFENCSARHELIRIIKTEQGVSQSLLSERQKDDK